MKDVAVNDNVGYDEFEGTVCVLLGNRYIVEGKGV